MAIKEILQLGDKKLKAENKMIENFEDPKLKEIIQDLTDTMRGKGLVGISAPQIGENYQIFTTEIKETETRPKDQTDELIVYINLEIIETSKEESVIYEGCGSVGRSQIFGPVNRAKIIVAQALNEKGEHFTIKCDGILARVIEHEYDHLLGIEFIEKVDDYTKLVSRENYIEKIRDLELQKENLVINIKEIKYANN